MSRKKRGGKPADSTGAILFLCPYLLLFGMFILLPIVLAIALSFTYFDGVQTPTFAGLSNYITILTQYHLDRPDLRSGFIGAPVPAGLDAGTYSAQKPYRTGTYLLFPLHDRRRDHGGYLEGIILRRPSGIYQWSAA